MIEKIGPTIYNSESIYNTGAGGGGGGGGDLPEGFKQSFFIEYYNEVNCIIQHNELTVNDDDYIEYCISTPIISTSNVSVLILNSEIGYFVSGIGQSQGNLVLYTVNNNVVQNVLNKSAENFVNLYIKKGSVIYNGTSTIFSKNPLLKFKSSFAITSSSNLIGCKLYYIRVYDSEDKLKNNLVFCMDENNHMCAYDKIAKIKTIVSDTAGFRLGPFM